MHMPGEPLLQSLHHRIALYLFYQGPGGNTSESGELLKHTTRYKDPGRRATWRTSIQELASWVGATTPDLIFMRYN